MNQQKIGGLLKCLRKEKKLTQEQLAEHFNVSSRTVSRWETGKNMPDISLLVELADFFEVSVPEIINGERKSEKMNEEMKEVAETLSDYAGMEKETIIKDIRKLSIIGTVALIVYCILSETKWMLESALFEQLALYCQTLAFVTILMMLAHTTGLLGKLQKRKSVNKLNIRLAAMPKVVQIVIIAIIAFAGAAVLKLLLNGLGV